VLDLVIAGVNRVRFDDLERQHIERIRAEHARRHQKKGGDRRVGSLAGAHAGSKFAVQGRHHHRTSVVRTNACARASQIAPARVESTKIG
jgi:hypothetical protein